MTYPVKWFSSDMRGAPTINGTAGALIAALDACLITGFGPVAPTGITVSGGIATATLPSGQSFMQHAVVLVSGATPSALNGEQRVLTASSTQITFATTAADGAASGTIEIRYAPVGQWEKVYTGTNKAVYRSLDVACPRHYLRVDDTGTTVARVRGFESMTDVDTGTGPFCTDTQMSGGGYWHKSTVASATANKWRLYGDSQVVLVGVAAGSGQIAANMAAPLRGFGFPITLRPGGDPWCSFLSAGGSVPNTQNGGMLDGGGTSGNNGFVASPRAWQGLGASVFLDTKPVSGGTSQSGNDAALGAFPSEVDGELKLARMQLVEQGFQKPPRAICPGVWHIPQVGTAGVIADGDIQIGSGDLAGRGVLLAATSTGLSTAVAGHYAVDITGPWR